MWLARLLTAINDKKGPVKGPFLCPTISVLVALFGRGVSGTVLLRSVYHTLK